MGIQQQIIEDYTSASVMEAPYTLMVLASLQVTDPSCIFDTIRLYCLCFSLIISVLIYFEYSLHLFLSIYEFIIANHPSPSTVAVQSLMVFISYRNQLWQISTMKNSSFLKSRWKRSKRSRLPWRRSLSLSFHASIIISLTSL